MTEREWELKRRQADPDYGVDFTPLMSGWSVAALILWLAMMAVIILWAGQPSWS